jgi:ABC-2 type transport system ATP-binding protein
MESLEKIILKDVQKKLNKNFKLSIENVAFEKNKIYSLIGNNGAGKTTFLALLCGLRKATKGQIFLNETQKFDENLEELKKHMGVYLDESFMFDYYTPREHFELFAEAFQISKIDLNTRLEKLNEVFLFEKYFEQLISSLSLGNRKKTGLLATLLSDPTLILWDEPFSGLDPGSQIRLKEFIEKQENKIFIISSHDLNHVSDISDEIIMLDDGKIVQHKSEKISHKELEGMFN